jgi:hypothetical protein
MTTATATLFTREEATKLLVDVLDNHRELFNRWLARGDGIAFYENKLVEAPVKTKKGEPDMHRLNADMQFVSFGSPAAQIETHEPPTRMPDIGSRINWRYQLIGIYRGEML